MSKLSKDQIYQQATDMLDPNTSIQDPNKKLEIPEISADLPNRLYEKPEMNFLGGTGGLMVQAWKENPVSRYLEIGDNQDQEKDPSFNPLDEYNKITSTYQGSKDMMFGLNKNKELLLSSPNKQSFDGYMNDIYTDAKIDRESGTGAQLASTLVTPDGLAMVGASMIATPLAGIALRSAKVAQFAGKLAPLEKELALANTELTNAVKAGVDTTSILEKTTLLKSQMSALQSEATRIGVLNQLGGTAVTSAGLYGAYRYIDDRINNREMDGTDYAGIALVGGAELAMPIINPMFGKLKNGLLTEAKNLFGKTSEKTGGDMASGVAGVNSADSTLANQSMGSPSQVKSPTMADKMDFNQSRFDVEKDINYEAFDSMFYHPNTDPVDGTVVDFDGIFNAHLDGKTIVYDVQPKSSIINNDITMTAEEKLARFKQEAKNGNLYNKEGKKIPESKVNMQNINRDYVVNSNIPDVPNNYASKKGYKTFGTMASKIYDEYGMGHFDSILLNQVSQESGFVAGLTSTANAKGLTQFIPETGAVYAKKIGLTYEQALKSPEAQFRMQALYMRDLLKDFKGDIHKAISAYNAGPGNVNKAVKKAQEAGKTGQFDWVSYLPKETKGYVNSIFGGEFKTASYLNKNIKIPQKATVTRVNSIIAETGIEDAVEAGTLRSIFKSTTIDGERSVSAKFVDDVRNNVKGEVDDALLTSTKSKYEYANNEAVVANIYKDLLGKFGGNVDRATASMIFGYNKVIDAVAKNSDDFMSALAKSEKNTFEFSRKHEKFNQIINEGRLIDEKFATTKKESEHIFEVDNVDTSSSFDVSARSRFFNNKVIPLEQSVTTKGKPKSVKLETPNANQVNIDYYKANPSEYMHAPDGESYAIASKANTDNIINDRVSQYEKIIQEENDSLMKRLAKSSLPVLKNIIKTEQNTLSASKSPVMRAIGSLLEGDAWNQVGSAINRMLPNNMNFLAMKVWPNIEKINKIASDAIRFGEFDSKTAFNKEFKRQQEIIINHFKELSNRGSKITESESLVAKERDRLIDMNTSPSIREALKEHFKSQKQIADDLGRTLAFDSPMFKEGIHSKRIYDKRAIAQIIAEPMKRRAYASLFAKENMAKSGDKVTPEMLEVADEYLIKMGSARKSSGTVSLGKTDVALENKINKLVEDGVISKDKADMFKADMGIMLRESNATSAFKSRSDLSFTSKEVMDVDGVTQEIDLMNLINYDYVTVETSYIKDASTEMSLRTMGIDLDSILTMAEKQRAQFPEEYSAIENMVNVMRGQRNIHTGEGKLYDALSALGQYSNARMLGGAAITAMGDYAIAASRTNAKAISQMVEYRNFLSNVKNGNIDQRSLWVMSMVSNDTVYHPFMRTFERTAEMFMNNEVASGATRVASHLADWGMTLSGERYMNSLMKNSVVLGHVFNVNELLFGSIDNVGKGMMRDLERRGFSKELLSRLESSKAELNAIWEKNGKEGLQMEYIHQLSPKSYKNFSELGAIIHDSMTYSVQTASIHTVPTWMHGSVGKLLGKFMSFPLDAIDKRLNNMLYHREFSDFRDFFMGTMGGMIAYVSKLGLKYGARGKDIPDDEISSERVILSSMMYNPYAHIGGTVMWDSIMHATGQKDLKINQYSRGLVDTMFNAGAKGTFGPVNDAGNLISYISDTMQGKKPLTFSGVITKTPIPYVNIPYIKPFFDISKQNYEDEVSSFEGVQMED